MSVGPGRLGVTDRARTYKEGRGPPATRAARVLDPRPARALASEDDRLQNRAMPLPRTRTQRFFLETTPADGEPRLSADEAAHALRVLRVREGDDVVGLDGRGRAWPLRIRSVSRRELALECTGPATEEPAPGLPGSTRPWVEVAVAWPRGPRADDLVAALTQLGVAVVRPLATRRAGPQDPAGKSDRRLRIARESCKQSGSLWLPRLEAPGSVAELTERPAHLAVLSPDPRAAGMRSWLDAAPAEAGSESLPIVCAVGPEGGFDEEESELLARSGTEVRLASTVLRIETAAVAAASVVMAHFVGS